MYFCAVKHRIWFIGLICCALKIVAQESFNFQLSTFNLDEVVLDIYNAVTEIVAVDFEQLQTDLYALHANPIDLNHTNEEELEQLYFLSPRQIDDILLYADRHPFESLYELQLIPSLADYEIRDLLPFVQIANSQQPTANSYNNIMYAREVFAHAKHELVARVDARNIEDTTGTDPIFAQFRYRFDYQRRVTFGAQLRRPMGGMAQDLQYGAYLQLTDIAPHVHKIVGGNYQASFGQGLVLASVYHSGKSMYVASAGMQQQGLRHYGGADGASMHGAGTTLRWEWGKSTRLDASALYSMRRANDSTWQHTVGANLTLRHKQLEVQLTGIENIWSDSIHPYHNAKYNQHYFRGFHQAVLGASVRYNYGLLDAFGEVATSQNHQSEITNDKSQITNNKWGVGTLVGCRFYPADGVSLIALYRYYSPWFDNAWGYGFSETSRINDENGGYIGFDITRLKNWRFSGYGDVFYFSGYKYGLGDATKTIGYDAMFETQYHSNQQSPYGASRSEEITNHKYWLSFRLRAKKKGSSTYSARFQFDWSKGPWSLRTTADGNYVSSYGISLAQDVAFDFSKLSTLNSQLPLSLKFRLQWFDAREWSNRIYLYEHDVLYSFSIPATYGLGGRGYLCLKWQIIKQLALYLRVSETVYSSKWASEHHRATTRTDVHLLLRATL